MNYSDSNYNKYVTKSSTTITSINNKINATTGNIQHCGISMANYGTYYKCDVCGKLKTVVDFWKANGS